MKFTQAVEETIRLADVRHTSGGGEPNHQHDSPMMELGEISSVPSPEDVRLRQFLDDLPRQIVYKLLVTMYLGLGDGSAKGWRALYVRLTHTFEKPSLAAAQLCEKWTLGDYLRTGRAKLAEAIIDFDDARP